MREKLRSNHYGLKVHLKESPEQFVFTELTIRRKEALRATGIRLGRAQYAETKGS